MGRHIERTVTLPNPNQLPKLNVELIPDNTAFIMAKGIFRRILKDWRDPKVREEYERFRKEYEAAHPATEA